jgi:hypothetical protein
MQEWIAYRFALLWADKRGRVTGGRRLNDHAARVALFLDLVLIGRLDPAEHPTRSWPLGRTVFVDPTLVSDERARLEIARDTGTADSPATAILLQLAEALGWFAIDTDVSLVGQCGLASPVVTDCCEYLRRLMDRLALISVLPDAGGS